MKKIFLILLSIESLICCNPKNIDKGSSKRPVNSKYYTKLDTITITTEIGDTIRYDKKKFNTLVDKHPEFFQDFPESPDKFYFCSGNTEFASEAGQDRYYILYTHFLKQRNGFEKYKEQRKTLNEIFSNINSIFAYAAYGGTYFGHQEKRIPAYAEYVIFLSSISLEKKNSLDHYDISQQKQIYIQSLRQIIEDENKIDFETVGQEKIDRIKKMNGFVDEIENLITNTYYLRCAQQFHYQHYQQF
ncbi:hypothetical protein [Chryseobacterium sp. c4a]|uniref:hypothetical protein n=1 Tax=Chryseobacterium sp. c4a TaxID=1573582 RepID=UPI001357A434|nr:hypothetical protein [Chryseobacterium sp. c4a]